MKMRSLSTQSAQNELNKQMDFKMDTESTNSRQKFSYECILKLFIGIKCSSW